MNHFVNRGEKYIQIIGIDGKVMINSTVEPSDDLIDISKLKACVYILRVGDEVRGEFIVER